jgi:phospholipase/lecithinase/hemolysin
MTCNHDFKNLVVFGDSLSDAGLTANKDPFLCRYRVTDPLYNVPTEHVYVSDNGNIWPVVLANLLGMEQNLHDYALCGATTTDVIKNQTSAYIEDFSTSAGKDLVFVWAGANDYAVASVKDIIFDSALVSGVTSNLVEIVSKVNQVEGEKLVVVVNLPDIGQFPSFSNVIGFADTEKRWAVEEYSPSLAKALDWVNDFVLLKPLKYMINFVVSKITTKDMNDHNAKLVSEIANFPKNAVLLDIHKLYADVMTHPEKYDVKNPGVSCYYDITATDVSACANAWHYDPKHPTNYAHTIIATYNCLALKDQGYVDTDCSGAVSANVYESIDTLVTGAISISALHGEL